MRKLIPLTLAALLAIGAFAAPTGWKILKEIKIGGEGGWDYLAIDSSARRLYVSHATHVVVVDPDSGKVVGDIPDTPGVHGIALAPALNRGFISNGRGNNVTIFDTKTMKTISQVATTGDNPDDITFEPKSGRVFTFNGRGNNATAIDAKTGMVVGTIAVGGKPEFAVSDDKGHVYANVEDTSEVIEVDAAKAAVTKRYSLAPCMDPSGLAIDVKKRRLFSVCSNRIMGCSHPDTGYFIASPAIGPGYDGVVFDPITIYTISSIADCTLT